MVFPAIRLNRGPANSERGTPRQSRALEYPVGEWKLPTFTCDLSRPPAPLDHFWEHTVGSGHAPLALRADWQAQLTQCHASWASGMCAFTACSPTTWARSIARTEQLLYSFFNADQIFDFLLSIGMRPFVELSFMPRRAGLGRHDRLSLPGQRHAAAQTTANGRR